MIFIITIVKCHCRLQLLSPCYVAVSVDVLLFSLFIVLFCSYNHRFLVIWLLWCDTMLTRYMLSLCVLPSVRHKPVLKPLNELSWFLA